MHRCKTRKQCYKVTRREDFIPIEGFLHEKLSTLKNVIHRRIYYKNRKTLTTVPEELFNSWAKYNVYPISIAGISKRLRTEMTEFSILYRYDKSK